MFADGSTKCVLEPISKLNWSASLSTALSTEPIISVSEHKSEVKSFKKVDIAEIVEQETNILNCYT